MNRDLNDGLDDGTGLKRVWTSGKMRDGNLKVLVLHNRIL